MTVSPGTKPSLMAVILPFSMTMDWLVVAGLPGSAIRWPAWMTIVFAGGGGAGVCAAGRAERGEKDSCESREDFHYGS